MSIVERLKERATSYRTGGPSSEHTAVMLEEAATTITELVEALQEVSTMLWSRPDIVNKLHPLMGFAEKATFEKARAAIAKATT